MILGMVPLFKDIFFASMAVTIMAGLGFASILALIGSLIFYHTIWAKSVAPNEKHSAGPMAPPGDRYQLQPSMSALRTTAE